MEANNDTPEEERIARHPAPSPTFIRVPPTGKWVLRINGGDAIAIPAGADMITISLEEEG